MNDGDATDACRTRRHRRVQAMRHRFQFRLRSLLIAVAALAIPMGWAGMKLKHLEQEQAAADWVREMSGYVNGEEGGVLFNGEQVSWCREVIASWGYYPVLRVNLCNTPVADISRLAACKDLHYLYLDNTEVSDLSAVKDLYRMKHLCICNTPVNDLLPVAK